MACDLSVLTKGSPAASVNLSSIRTPSTIGGPHPSRRCTGKGHIHLAGKIRTTRDQVIPSSKIPESRNLSGKIKCRRHHEPDACLFLAGFQPKLSPIPRPESNQNDRKHHGETENHLRYIPSSRTSF